MILKTGVQVNMCNMMLDAFQLMQICLVIETKNSYLTDMNASIL